MKDFLLIMPRDWKDFKIAPMSTEGILNKNNDNACFFIDDFKQTIPNENSLEILIDYQGCHILAAKHSPKSFKQRRVDAVDFSYYFSIDLQIKEIIASSCLFGILPIYYCEDEDKLLVSNRARLVAERSSIPPGINQKFLIEMALFNYSFQNDTIYEGIKLLPSNSMLTWNGKLHIGKYLTIEDYFCSNPKSKRQTIDSLRDLFIVEVEKYFSIKKSALSFTSGFDGRTILACSRYYHKKFDTYSFGTIDNDDIYVPQATAERLGIPYMPIILDEDYAENAFFSDGVELMNLTDGNNNLLKVHHLYSAKCLAKDHDCLLNGMFGSELFRALHISGQVTSKELVSLFLLDDMEAVAHSLKESPKLSYFNKPMILDVLDDVLEEVFYYKSEMNKSELSKNQQFYKYIFEEAFRKNFGYIINAQMKYLNIRSPFLNFNFIKELFKSELAGVNNNFFTHNPLKRLKGQFLYAKILKKTDPELNWEKTTKGYCPNDLLTFQGKAKVAYGYFKKKLVRKIGAIDYNNLMIVSGINKNKMNFLNDQIPSIIKSNTIQKILESKMNNNNRDVAIRFISIIHFITECIDKIQ